MKPSLLFLKRHAAVARRLLFAAGLPGKREVDPRIVMTDVSAVENGVVQALHVAVEVSRHWRSRAVCLFLVFRFAFFSTVAARMLPDLQASLLRGSELHYSSFVLSCKGDRANGQLFFGFLVDAFVLRRVFFFPVGVGGGIAGGVVGFGNSHGFVDGLVLEHGPLLALVV